MLPLVYYLALSLCTWHSCPISPQVPDSHQRIWLSFTHWPSLQWISSESTQTAYHILSARPITNQTVPCNRENGKVMLFAWNDSDRRLRLSEVSPGTRIYGLLAQGDVLEWDTMIPLKWCPDGPGTTCLSWAVSQNGATPFGFNERIVKVGVVGRPSLSQQDQHLQLQVSANICISDWAGDAVVWVVIARCSAYWDHQAWEQKRDTGRSNRGALMVTKEIAGASWATIWKV